MLAGLLIKIQDELLQSKEMDNAYMIIIPKEHMTRGVHRGTQVTQHAPNKLLLMIMINYYL